MTMSRVSGAYQPEQLRISSIRITVPMSETMIDPTQPRRFEKKANTRSYRERCFDRFYRRAAVPSRTGN